MPMAECLEDRHAGTGNIGKRLVHEHLRRSSGPPCGCHAKTCVVQSPATIRALSLRNWKRSCIAIGRKSPAQNATLLPATNSAEIDRSTRRANSARLSCTSDCVGDVAFVKQHESACIRRLASLSSLETTLAFVSLDKPFNRHEPDCAEERNASRVIVRYRCVDAEPLAEEAICP